MTAQRAAALERLGLVPSRCPRAIPRLCHVAITGHAPPDDGLAGHDLTYLAPLGLVDPPLLPPTLFADMAGAELAVSTALALLLGRERGERRATRTVALADAAHALAAAVARGPHASRRAAGWRLSLDIICTLAIDGWIAVAVLEPRFAERLAALLGPRAPRNHGASRERFGKHDTAHWESWAREHDLPIVAVRDPHKEKNR